MFKNKEEAYFAMIFAAAFALVLITVIIVTAILYYNRKKRNLIEKQTLQSQFSQTLLQSQLEIQEQTLKTISQEIHDNIGQVLSLAKLNLNTIDQTKQEEAAIKIVDSKNLVSKAIQDLRDLSRSLNTDNIAAMGLLRAIEYELEMIRKAGKYQTLLETEGNVQKLDPQKELIVFRIIQEVLNNILKHADATAIKIHAAYNAELRLTITDDGSGFNISPNPEKETLSLGLRNMESRAKLIGADFSINSSPGNGTTVTLGIPLTNSTI